MCGHASSGRFAEIVAMWTAVAMLAGCARVIETHSLRARPLESPKMTVVEAEEGFQVRGKRDGAVVRIQVARVRYCKRVTEQRAMGLRRTERRADGHSLLLEWLFGAVLTGTGASVIGYSATHPPKNEPDATVNPGNQQQAYLHGGIIGVIGLGLLGSAVWQQASLGITSEELGERVLKSTGLTYPCRATKATAGRVRLTLDDGLQIYGDVDETGHAVVELPDDIERRISAEGRKATLEAIGDWRSQTRIRL